MGRALSAVVLLAALSFAWNAADEVIDRKFEGSDSSMGIRFDQVDSAVALWSESPVRFLIGTGLGSGFPDGRERNYSEFQYIELQSLYLLVQLGFAGMLLYLVTLAIGVHRFLDVDGRAIFWLYALSGSSNPTILDANQIIATVLLVCLFPRRGNATKGRTPLVSDNPTAFQPAVN
jgi:O-antigen ligase